MTQVGVVPPNLNLTLNRTHHEISTLKKDWELQRVPFLLIIFIFPDIPMLCPCLAFENA